MSALDSRQSCVGGIQAWEMACRVSDAVAGAVKEVLLAFTGGGGGLLQASAKVRGTVFAIFDASTETPRSNSKTKLTVPI